MILLNPFGKELRERVKALSDEAIWLNQIAVKFGKAVLALSADSERPGSKDGNDALLAMAYLLRTTLRTTLANKVTELLLADVKCTAEEWLAKSEEEQQALMEACYPQFMQEKQNDAECTGDQSDQG